MTQQKILCVGEAMIEMAPTGPSEYRRGFAGDTFNTAWHLAQILKNDADVGFGTCVGVDAVSSAFVQKLHEDGLSTAAITRSQDRSMGLYLISLLGAERSFQYWRDTSAARLLADDPDALEQSFQGATLIHLSGITIAILSQDARHVLRDALLKAHAQGTRVSFDPNLRPALWSSLDHAGDEMERFLKLADIALPSFDDEAMLWGDPDPDATLERIAALGPTQIAVKNGSGAVTVFDEGQRSRIATPEADQVRDTTGAGDAFNAGFLAANLRGHPIDVSVRAGKRLAAIVLACPGALADKGMLGNFKMSA